METRYVNTETLKRNIRVNFMPNVDVDGTVTVENAERYFLNMIDKTSTADVAEVVRCCDCKYYSAVTHNGEPMHYGYCKNKHDEIYGAKNRYERDFCSYGEGKVKQQCL